MTVECGGLIASIFSRFSFFISQLLDILVASWSWLHVVMSLWRSSFSQILVSVIIMNHV